MKTSMKLLVDTGLMTTQSLFAVDLANREITATVQNSFTIQESSSLTFGTIRAVADVSTNQATLIIGSDGTTVTANQASPAFITVVSDGTPATYTITGAAPNTRLTITDPSAVTLSHTNPTTTNNPTFTVNGFEYTVTTGGTSSPYTGSNLQTDGTGSASFSLGVTLSTQASATAATAGDLSRAYEDGSYRGTYTMTVNY